MDADRVRAYLQVACAGLGFDIGEVWWMQNDGGTSTLAAIEERGGREGGSSGEETFAALTSRRRNGKSRGPRKRFLQLYTSKAYCNQRSKLVQPHPEKSEVGGDGGSSNNNNNDNNNNYNKHGGAMILHRRNSFNNNDENEHVLSPRIVEAVTLSAKVVWANCQKTEGLLGRSDIKLQTAIGMPVGVDESGNVWVVVMFSPNNVESSSDAIDYLQYISRSAAMGTRIPCLLPVIPNDEDDTTDRPNVILDEHGGGETHGHHHTLVQIQPKIKQPDSTQDLGEGVTARFVSFRLSDDDDGGNDFQITRRPSENDLRNAPQDDFGIPMLPVTAQLNNQANPPSMVDAINDELDA